MHTMVKNRADNLWTVGFYFGNEWHPLRDFDHEDAAACYVNYLNGGTGNLFMEPHL